MNIQYIWFKILKKLRLSAIHNSSFEKPSRVESGSTVINSRFGHYSYGGSDCTFLNCRIGRFCSISDHVVIGQASHPMDWVSTSPAFYRGRDSIPKNLAKLDYDYRSPETIIGNDVWIGEGVLIKAGVCVGNGAIIGMGSIVTKDVPNYAVVAGAPARVIRMRFSPERIERFEKTRWWEKEPDRLKEYAELMNDPEAFLQRIESEE